jgi:DNA modification methylase
MIDRKRTALNGICPYFTMFPLDFPYTILHRHALPGQWVIDPFCGRGTTNYASRIFGLPTIGIDSNPVAVALSQAKLANTSPECIMQAAHQILDEVSTPQAVPVGEFWEWAFHKDVLHLICRFREGLLRDGQSDARKALRAILMGALHGPRPKTHPYYLSNQSQRTYAPKPRYAVKFWTTHHLAPEYVDVLSIIETRAQRFYAQEQTTAIGEIIHGDSREQSIYTDIAASGKVGWVITSPPYYGMNTYLPDQWLRSWFLGGPALVEYSSEGQMSHASPESFALQLKRVWQNVGMLCIPGARLVIRFGAINDRKVDALALVKQSLKDSGWRIQTVRSAGSASAGRRQALHIIRTHKRAIEEHDVWGIWEG